MLHNTQPTLYIFSGLPGTGKSTLAQRLASKLRCVYLQIDTIEQAIRDLCSFDVQGEGYRLAYRVAADNLRIGLSVIADSCNPVELTRTEWEDVARDSGARHLNFEILCSDKVEHPARVETRVVNIQGLKLPTWLDVEQREYHAWAKHRVEIDTFGKSTDESFDQLYRAILDWNKNELTLKEAEQGAPDEPPPTALLK